MKQLKLVYLKSWASGQVTETRRESVARAIHSAELEGQAVSADFMHDATEYIKGTINADQLVERTKTRIMERELVSATK